MSLRRVMRCGIRALGGAGWRGGRRCGRGGLGAARLARTEQSVDGFASPNSSARNGDGFTTAAAARAAY